MMGFMIVVMVVTLVVFVALVVFVVLMLRELEGVSSVFTFDIFSIVGVLAQLQSLHGPCVAQGRAEFTHQDGFVIKGLLACWHGVGHGRRRCVIAHVLEGGVHPGFKPQPVIEEQITGLEANDVECRRTVIVSGDVRG